MYIRKALASPYWPVLMHYINYVTLGDRTFIIAQVEWKSIVNDIFRILPPHK